MGHAGAFVLMSLCDTSTCMIVGVYYHFLLRTKTKGGAGDNRHTMMICVLIAVLLMLVLWFGVSLRMDSLGVNLAVYLVLCYSPFLWYFFMCWRVWRLSADVGLTRPQQTDLYRQSRWLVFSAAAIVLSCVFTTMTPTSPFEMLLAAAGFIQCDIVVHAAQTFVWGWPCE